jgi:hypothetical protein
MILKLSRGKYWLFALNIGIEKEFRPEKGPLILYRPGTQFRRRLL